MAQFHGTIQGNGLPITRLGSKLSGLTVEAAGWKGKIVVRVADICGTDHYEVWLEPHKGSGGHKRTIASGVLDSTA